jgi:hypothetical protein
MAAWDPNIDSDTIINIGGLVHHSVGAIHRPNTDGEWTFTLDQLPALR